MINKSITQIEKLVKDEKMPKTTESNGDKWFKPYLSPEVFK